MLQREGSETSNSDDNSGSVKKNEIYNGKEEKLVLTLLSDLYSELKAIFISTSGPSSCPTLHCRLTTSTTNYCSKEEVTNFGLRRLFYSK